MTSKKHVARALPALPSRVDPELKPLLTAIKEVLEVQVGHRGEDLDKAVTFRDLTDSGIATFKAESNGISSVLEPVINVGAQTAPPNPVTLTASATFTNVLLSWSGGFRHDLVAATEVYRSTSDNLSAASHIGSTSSFVYTDTVEPASTHYYWIRFISPAGVPGAYNATDGTVAVTSKKVSDLFADLNDSFPADGFKISGGASEVIPFAVVGTATYINTALIMDASIDVAKISNLSVDMAQVTGTLTANQINTGLITSDKINAPGISADRIKMDGNIEFQNTQSGIQFGKDSLGSTAAGAFFGRSGGVAGFHISSATSGIYADSSGTVALNNVRLYTGAAGSAVEYPNPGQVTQALNISSLTPRLYLIIIGGGGGSSNNASGTLGGGQSGSAGGGSYVQWFTGQNGTGSIIQTTSAEGGAGLTHGQVASNISGGGGAAGMPSSKAAGGAGGAGNGGAGSAGTFGSGGGGGGGTSGSGNTGNAPVTGRAAAGITFSQNVDVPIQPGTGNRAQSLKIFVGYGGAGGAGQSQTYNDNSGNWSGFDLVAGGNGGNGFVSVADPNAGGIEVDLLNILSRLTALEG